MYTVQLEFANRTETHTFADRVEARNYSDSLLAMFDVGFSESWFDEDSKTYVVTVPHLEVERI